MLKFLLPVDGSDTSNKAVAGFIKLLDWYKEVPEIHLLNVQFPQRGNVNWFIDKESINLYHQEEGMKVVASRTGVTGSGGHCLPASHHRRGSGGNDHTLRKRDGLRPNSHGAARAWDSERFIARFSSQQGNAAFDHAGATD